MMITDLDNLFNFIKFKLKISPFWKIVCIERKERKRTFSEWCVFKIYWMWQMIILCCMLIISNIYWRNRSIAVITLSDFIEMNRARIYTNITDDDGKVLQFYSFRSIIRFDVILSIFQLRDSRLIKGNLNFYTNVSFSLTGNRSNDCQQLNHKTPK